MRSRSRHCHLRGSFVSPPCSAVHLLPRVRPLNMRPQLADGCRQQRLCSEPSDTTSSALTNYGKWREWLLLAAAVTAIKGPGPPTQMADSRHIHTCFSSFLFFLLPQHSRHRSGEQGERRRVTQCICQTATSCPERRARTVEIERSTWLLSW